MKSWNPFGKIDMEVGSFLKASMFNKDYLKESNANKEPHEKYNKEVQQTPTCNKSLK